jgi:hypothetical protein
MSRFDYSGPVKTNVKRGGQKPSRAVQMAKRSAGSGSTNSSRPQWHKDAAARTQAGARSPSRSVALSLFRPTRKPTGTGRAPLGKPRILRIT